MFEILLYLHINFFENSFFIQLLNFNETSIMKLF